MYYAMATKKEKIFISIHFINIILEFLIDIDSKSICHHTCMLVYSYSKVYK